MAERPILFNGAMVRAILAGQKTQTRRAVKPQPFEASFLDAPGQYLPSFEEGRLRVATSKGAHLLTCPFGRPGDRLWVRETWAQPTTLDPGPSVYRADYPACVPDGFENVPPAEEIRWRPSIHMPRWACRLVLEITDVRVERLQAISARDCQGEGIQSDAGGGFHVEGGTHYSTDPIESFASLWTSTGGDWDSNPWVWVIEFKRVEPAHG